MKVLIIAPDTSYLPVGLAYISASIAAAGHEIDTCYLGEHVDVLSRADHRYDVIATGGMSSQLRSMRAIRDIARKYGATFIIGGQIISADPETMAPLLGMDYGVIGEGEAIIVELLDCLQRGESPGIVCGIIYKAHDSYVMTPAKVEYPDINLIPWPDLDRFGYAGRLDFARPSDMYYLDVFDHPREYPILTSRTCPFSCTFCFQPQSAGRYRVRNLDNVFDELRSVVFKHKINIVSIYDELFHSRNDRLIEFCERFKAFRKTVPWELVWSCQARVTNVTDDLLSQMRESGCFMISYGIESYSPIVLHSMNKKISLEKIDYALAATLRQGISVQGNFIFGDTAETLETAQQTLDYWKSNLSCGIVLYPLLPVPGSPIYHTAREKGLLPDLEDYLENSYFEPRNLTALSEHDHAELRRRIFQYKLLKTNLQAPTRATQDSITLRCPHCGHVNAYKNYYVRTAFFDLMHYCRGCRHRFYSASLSYRIYAQIVGHIIVNVATYDAYMWLDNRLRRAVRAFRRYRNVKGRALLAAVSKSRSKAVGGSGPLPSDAPTN